MPLHSVCCLVPEVEHAIKMKKPLENGLPFARRTKIDLDSLLEARLLKHRQLAEAPRGPRPRRGCPLLLQPPPPRRAAAPPEPPAQGNMRQTMDQTPSPTLELGMEVSKLRVGSRALNNSQVARKFATPWERTMDVSISDRRLTTLWNTRRNCGWSQLND